MKSKLVSLFLLCSVFSYSQDYSVQTIPEHLKTEMNAVVRHDHTQFTILDKNKGTSNENFVVTILNEKGNRYARKAVHYNKLTHIKNIEARVFDSNGKQIKKLKSSEIYDHASYDGMSLYSDSRFKEINLSQPIYPYTIEYKIEIEYDYLYSIPGTYFLSDKKVSVQNVSYEIIFPSHLAPRYKIIGIEDKVVKGKIGDAEFMRWKYENLMPLKPEPFGPGPESYLPHLILAPSQFEYGGYAGDMSSWNAYGKWQLLLNKDRDVLPSAVKTKVHEIKNTAHTTKGKVKALYEYMQNKTRYVGIQDGIGGLQPFPAQIVDEVGYGDCKGLSNYMIALLKEAGIKSYYTKILAGKQEPEILLDFPSHQTNHIIVSVPLDKDTIWLECTDQQNPFGYLGTFTGDRYAIMVTEDGGKIVRTPKYPSYLNRQIRLIELTLNGDGNGTAKTQTTYTGIQFENDNLNQIINQHPEDQKKWLNKTIEIPSFIITSFKMDCEKGVIPKASVKADLKLDRYASVSGKRMFVTPNVMSRSTFIPEKVESRTQMVYWKENYEDYDTVRIKLPEGIYPEFVPQPIKVESPFGSYQASFEFKDMEVIYIRSIKVWEGKHPPEAYQELIDFYKSVNKADNIKLVFLTKT